MDTEPEAMMTIGLVWVLAPEHYRSESPSPAQNIGQIPLLELFQ